MKLKSCILYTGAKELWGLYFWCDLKAEFYCIVYSKYLKHWSRHMSDSYIFQNLVLIAKVISEKTYKTLFTGRRCMIKACASILPLQTQ